MPSHDADQYLREVIRISDEMIEVAYQGDACRDDVGCGVVFGSVRDKAYKVRKLAEEELARHLQTNAQGEGARTDAAPSDQGRDHHE